MDSSNYGNAAALVSIAVCFGTALISYIVALSIFAYARIRQRATKMKVWVMCAIILFGNACFVVGLGVLSGFDLLPPALTFLIACVCIAVLTFLGMPIFSNGWKVAFLDSAGLWQSFKSYCSTSFKAAVTQPAIFHAGCLIGYLFCYAVIFSLYGVCYCSKPFVITTWASRRDQPKYCFDDAVCHQYVMLGYNSSRLRVVSHIVSSAGQPQRTWATVCQVDEQDRCVAAEANITGRVVAHHPTTDDPRYLSHVLLTSLNGSTSYAATVYFTLASGRNVSKSLSFTTVPDANDTRELQFVSGGDLESTNEGQNFLLIGFLKADPHFVMFGGDLAYANNMRTCYLRMDYYCALIASLQNPQGRSVPLMILTGNHESGGYLLNSQQWNKFYFVIEYFPQYDEDEPPSWHVTHHTHHVGANLALIGLDSNLLEPAVSQVPYATRELQRAAREDRFPVTAYHNPLFPSVRDYDDSASDTMRNVFASVFEANRLPLSLEFHDHAYKRTHPMLGTDISPNRSGTVFVGDGGMGIQRSADELSFKPYLKVLVARANVQVVTIFRNKSANVASYGSDISLLDSVDITRW